MPISQRDPGTLADRIFPPGMVAKTGTLWDVSTLGGLINAEDQPLGQLEKAPHNGICFAILNRGEDLDFFYTSQEEFVAQIKAYLQPPKTEVSTHTAP
jgi:hypothetical protein